MKTPSEMARNFGYLGYLALLSCIATLIAMIAGTFVALFALGGMSLIVFLVPTMLVSAAYLALVFAAPVTFGLLPLSAFLMRSRPTLASLALPLIGALGGAATMWIWLDVSSHIPSSSASSELLVVSGMMAGLAAGAFYGRAIREICA